MKGPGLRIDLDVRRIWRCAKCGRTARTPAHVVSQRCGCSDEAPWMRLEPPVKREPFRAPVREPLPDPDAEEAAETVAASPAAVAENQQAEIAVAEQPTAELERIATDVVQQALEAAARAGSSAPANPPAPPESVESPPAAAPPADEFGAGVEGGAA